MKPNLKLGLLISILVLAALACATLTGDGNAGGGNTSTGGTGNGDTGADTGSGSGSTGSGTGSTNSANILFEDDFSNPGSGWDRYSDDEGYTDYANGAYKIGIYTDTFFYWANPYQNFGDVIVEVQGQKISGDDDMQYGIICRHQDIDNFYALVVSGDGWAAIRKRTAGGELTYLVDWVAVSSVNTGNRSNNLRAECVGSRLSLYVNNTLAVEVNDTGFSSGDVGLMAGTFEQTSTEVLFDNFVVRKP